VLKIIVDQQHERNSEQTSVEKKKQMQSSEAEILIQ